MCAIQVVDKLRVWNDKWTTHMESLFWYLFSKSTTDIWNLKFCPSLYEICIWPPDWKTQTHWMLFREINYSNCMHKQTPLSIFIVKRRSQQHCPHQPNQQNENPRLYLEEPPILPEKITHCWYDVQQSKEQRCL